MKQVCTVLSVHFHGSWDSSARSEKEAFVLPCCPCLLSSWKSVQITDIHREKFSSSLMSSTALTSLCCMDLGTQLPGAELEFLSGNSFNYFQDKRGIFSDFPASLEGGQILFSVTIRERKRNYHFAEHCSRHCAR